MKWSRFHSAWLSPQNMVAALLFIGAVLLWYLASSESAPPAPIIPQWSEQADATPTTSYQRKQITVVIFQDAVERVLLMDVALALEPSQAVQQIMAQLRQNMAARWPEGLELSQVFSTTLLRGQPSVILNFSVKPTIVISVAEERALYQSITETLERNGYNHYTLLINDSLRPYFIEYISLPTSVK